ncbi:hypothetical protein B0H16DRAFT_1740968 [Mycena metata]|uniref:F-box domain-containing protein n=1 Tax=Mycena metata TaxID=1033252 RepID=A0AAD7HBH5_9AGAR|nr:hypothetical protein B0H16DRAFT_1740968 [Mycena metata]
MSGSEASDGSGLNSVDVAVRNSSLSLAYINGLQYFDVMTSNIPFTRVLDEPDLLLKILLHVPEHFDRNATRYEQSLYQLGGVCRRFRSAILAEPTFWCCVYISVTNADTEHLAEYIARAAAAPLCIVIAPCPVVAPHADISCAASPGEKDIYARQKSLETRWRRLLLFLQPYLHQCRSLYMETSNPRHTDILFRTMQSFVFPQLSSLHLDIQTSSIEEQRHSPVAFPFASAASGLRYLHVDNFVLGMHQFSSCLTEFRLWCHCASSKPTMDEALDLLRSMPLLSKLQLHDFVVVEDLPAPLSDGLQQPVNAVTLPLIHELALSWHESASMSFWAALRLPGLKTLRLDAPNLNGFGVACPQLLHQVSTIVLLVEPSVAGLQKVLQSAAVLQHLDVHGMYQAPLYISALLAHWPEMCPQLSSLWFDEFVEDEMLVGMIKVFNAEDSLRRHLRVISLKGFSSDGLVTIPYETYMQNGVITARASASTSSNSPY